MSEKKGSNLLSVKVESVFLLRSMLVITEKTMEQGFQINIYEIMALILSELAIMTTCACN
jgi:hypothetical protein